MRIIASIFTVAFAAVTAPAALACRIAPEPIGVPKWESAPTPTQLLPGEVALEVELAGYVRPSGSFDPDLIILDCRAFQDVFRIVRVIAGDAHGAEFVITPGTTSAEVTLFDPNASSTSPRPIFLVGNLSGQREHFISASGQESVGIPMLSQGSDLIASTIPVITSRWSPK